ncbi:hypothetical protein CK230_15880 [Mesorhizobium sp. WSM3859]|nr:hypothetical protein CK230_15880 [Mesorhizobium sp. WSM3859]
MAWSNFRKNAERPLRHCALNFLEAKSKKAEQKPRFLDVAICRRSIRGRQIINHYFLAKEYDENTTVLTEFDPVFRRLCVLV